MFQMKKQDKTPEDKQSEMEIRDLPHKEQNGSGHKDTR